MPEQNFLQFQQEISDVYPHRRSILSVQSVSEAIYMQVQQVFCTLNVIQIQIKSYILNTNALI